MRKWLRCIPALVVPVVAQPAGASAQDRPDTLRLVMVIEYALDANPALAAARLLPDATAERIPQAGAWGDPQLSRRPESRPVRWRTSP